MASRGFLEYMVAAVLSTALTYLPLTARADVRMQSVTHFGGIAGMGASDITSTSYLQGHKKRTESNIKFTGAVLGALQKWMSHDNGNNLIDIYLVDQNQLLELHPDKKTYAERAIYTPPQPVQEQQAVASSTPGPQQHENNDVRVVKSEFDVKNTGESRNINGFSTHHYVVTWYVETENLKTHERGKSLMTTDMWNSTDARFETVHKEELAYSQAYLKLLHLPEMYSRVDVKQLGLDKLPFTTARNQEELFHKMSQIKGYPVVVDVRWEGGCENCQNSKQSQPPPSEQQNLGNSGSLGGLLGGLLAKKAEQKTQNDQQNPSGTPGMTVIFSSHTELKSLDTSGIPASMFSVPAGYTRS